MKKVLQIFQRDLKRLLRSPAAALVMVGVCILPSLYAWFNIAANMDPYGNTKNVKVAIANCDPGGHTDSMDLNAGDTIVQNLKKNHQLGWTFVDEKKAKSGVHSGKYYAAIVIPEDFSESLLSILSENLKQTIILMKRKTRSLQRSPLPAQARSSSRSMTPFRPLPLTPLRRSCRNRPVH